MNNKSNAEDILLVNEFLLGNREIAFKKIYNKYFKKVRTKLLIATRDEFLAEDLTSEVLMKVYNKLETYDGEKSTLFTWINGVATYHFIDHLRKEKKRKEVFMNNITDNTAEYEQRYQYIDKALNPEETLNREEKNNILRDTIKNAIKKQSVRDLVNMRYFEELSYEEIAAATETPIGSVKNILFRARGAMQEYLEKISSKELLLH